MSPDPLNPSQSPTFAYTPTAGESPSITRLGPPSVVVSTAPPLYVPGFELLEPVGRGGMGIVYKARQLHLNRLVALKMVLGDHEAESKELIRFLAEAESVASVSHPNVVRVYEFGEADGRPFLAMELLEGGSLSQKIAAGAMAPMAAAALVAKIARGVQAAHDQGIVHRDLKPGNVLFDETSEPKVTDFGLAKRRGGAELTQTGAVIGTPQYMAPEQAKGETKYVGPTADVWALGTILHECLSGRPAFQAEDTWSVLLLVMTGEALALRDVAPGTPRDLDLICRKCLMKEPRDRYATATELAEDLDRFVRGEAVLARPLGPAARLSRWAKRSPWLAAAAAVAVVAALGFIAALFVGYHEAVGRAETEVARAGAERQLREQETEARAVAERLREQEAQARTEAERLRAQADTAKAAAEAEVARANQVSDFLTTLFRSSDPLDIFGDVVPPNWEKQRQKTGPEFLKEAAVRFQDQTLPPLVRAKLLASVGSSFSNLGMFRDAEPLLRESLKLRKMNLPPDRLEVAESEIALGKLNLDVGNYTAALEHFQTARGIQERAAADEKLITTSKLFEGWALGMLADPRAETQVLKCIDDRVRLYGRNHPQTLIARAGLIGILLDQGKIEAVTPQMTELVTGIATEKEDSQLRTLIGLLSTFQTGVMLRMNAKGDLRDFLLRQSETTLRNAVGGGLKHLPPDNVYLMMAKFELATTLFLEKKDAEAEVLYSEVLDQVERSTGLAHPKAHLLVERLAARYLTTNRAGQARALFDKTDAAVVERFGPDAHWRATLALFRCEIEARFGDVDRAVAAARAALAIDSRQPLSATVSTLLWLGEASEGLGSTRSIEALKAAADLQIVARRIASAVRGPTSFEVIHSYRFEGNYRLRAGQRAAGADLLLKAESLLQPTTQVSERCWVLAARGQLENALGRYEVGERYFLQALALAEKFQPIPGDRCYLHYGLAESLVGQGKQSDALKPLTEARAVSFASAEVSNADKAIAGMYLAGAKFAIGHDEGYAEDAAGLVARFAKPGSEFGAFFAVCRLVALAPGPHCAALADRLAKFNLNDNGRRVLALLRLRSGNPTSASRLSGTTASELAILGLAALARGEHESAKMALTAATTAIATSPGPSDESPHWYDRIEALALTTELTRRLAAEAAPQPRAPR